MHVRGVAPYASRVIHKGRTAAEARGGLRVGLLTRIKAIERPLALLIVTRAGFVLLFIAMYAAGVVGQDIHLRLWPGLGVAAAWTVVLGICALVRPQGALATLLKVTAPVDAVTVILLVPPLLAYSDPVYALVLAETVTLAILLKRRVAWLLGGIMALAYLTGHVLSSEVLQPVQYLALVLKIWVLLGSSISTTIVVAHLEQSRAEALTQRAHVEELNCKLEWLSNTDELTGIANYRALQQRLDEELVRAKRHRTRLSVLMLDLDDFKRINDTFGHQVGDVVLAEVAAIFRGSVRAMDVVTRYGGEEFTIVLPETDLRGAQVAAEKVRDAVAGHRFPDLDGKRDIRLTVSIGVATYPDHAANKEALLSVADNAVYNAKESGKNRVAAPNLLEWQSALELETGHGAPGDGETLRIEELIS